MLRSFSAEEFRQLEKFIDSPYHNKGRDLIPFFRILKAFYPEFSQKNFTNENIYERLFPGKSHGGAKSDNLIRTLSSHLFRVCKDYLIQIETENQEAKRKYFLLNQLRKRNLYKEFDREFEAAYDGTEDDGKGSAGYFIDRMLIDSVKSDCSLSRDDFENAFEFRLKASEDVATAALISAFKFEDEKNLAEAYNIKIRNNLLQSLLSNLDSKKFVSDTENSNPKLYPYFSVFHLIYLMNRYKDKREYYFQLKELLMKHKSLFGQPENYVLWNIMQTYCGVNMLGDKEYHQLHRYIIENRIYKILPTENFHIVLFRNIVLTASGVREFEWLEKFINKYSPELHEKHRDNMKAYSMAYLHFTRSEFEKALEYVLKIKYSLFLFKIDLRILQLKVYYELGYYEEGLSLVSATLEYLNNSKEVTSRSKQSIGAFTKCLKELIKIKSGDADSDFGKLKLIVKEIKYPGVADWIVNKIKELES